MENRVDETPAQREMRQEFTLPILGWTLFGTAQGWRIRFPDGREDWPDPRERQIIIAFRNYAVEMRGALRKFGQHPSCCNFRVYEVGKVKTAEKDCDCGLTAALRQGER